MATEAWISAAARGPSKPGPSPGFYGDSDGVIRLAVLDAEVAARQAAAARRTALRIALGRHDCPMLPACEEHKRQVCGCRPCVDPEHEADFEAGLELMRAAGLIDPGPVLFRRCKSCRQVRAAGSFKGTGTTCGPCRARKTRRQP